jgi:DNA helicase TIP49 (TBP-interacting protein)
MSNIIDTKKSRVYAHSHISGLGLQSDGTAIEIGGGLVGQKAAREVPLEHRLTF